jgi:hypothetical protein
MSITTILLIGVAVGVTFLMLRTARDTRRAAESSGESPGDVGGPGDAGVQATVDDQAEHARDVAPPSGPHGGHGCC